MEIKLEPTSERVIEDAYQNNIGSYFIYLMHIASYNFAKPFCTNKSVLELGCGSGYGSARIASVAQHIEAVDVAEDAIEYANSKYAANNLRFSKIDPTQKIPFTDEQFDVVLSFQVIEHVLNDKAYLQEAQRLLKKGGVLLLITPDRKHRLFPIQKPWNRWHIREYSKSQLENLVSKFFIIQKSLCMSAQAPYPEIELNRYRTTKILTLPFTLKIIPEYFRQLTLAWLQKSKQKSLTAKINENKSFDFNESVIEFKEHHEKSLNLVIVAQKQ